MADVKANPEALVPKFKFERQLNQGASLHSLFAPASSTLEYSTIPSEDGNYLRGNLEVQLH